MPLARLQFAEILPGEMFTEIFESFNMREAFAYENIVFVEPQSATGKLVQVLSGEQRLEPNFSLEESKLY